MTKYYLPKGTYKIKGSMTMSAGVPMIFERDATPEECAALDAALCNVNNKQKGEMKMDELNGKIVMAILQRGWVFVGRYQKNGSHITLSPVANYRYQGSGKGFVFVAGAGPTSNCKLDKCETLVRYHELTEVAAIACTEAAWSDKL